MDDELIDPLDNSRGVPFATLAALRRGCPVSQTASGAYFLARYDDVLAATKNVATFQASFRQPGVVVQFWNSGTTGTSMLGVRKCSGVMKPWSSRIS